MPPGCWNSFPGSCAIVSIQWDVSDVGRVDSAGMMLFIHYYDLLKSNKCSIKVIGVKSEHERMYESLRPQSGEIKVLGQNLLTVSRSGAATLRHQCGFLFQAGALYSSLAVEENVGIKLREYSDIPLKLIRDIVRMKINMVGLPEYAAELYPAELSGGMVKRAVLARALAMDRSCCFSMNRHQDWILSERRTLTI